MECKYCKTQNSDDFIYCINCGRKLKEEAPSFRFDLSVSRTRKILIGAAALLVLLAALLIFRPFSPKTKSPYSMDDNTIHVIQKEENCFVFEDGKQKARIDEAQLQNKRYSFDGSALAVVTQEKEDTHLYVYRGGKLNPICVNYSRYLLSDDGNKVFYIDEEDDSVHLYDVKKHADKVVISTEEQPRRLEYYAFSHSGAHLAFISREEEGRVLNLYSSDSITALAAENPAAIIAVNENKEVYYLDEEGMLHVCDKDEDVLLLEDVEMVYLNLDHSEIAVRYDECFYICQNKEAKLCADKGTSKILGIVLPKNLQRENLLTGNQGKITFSIYHYGIDSFTNKFYTCADSRILQIRKNMKADVITEKTYRFIVSADGERLIYMDEEGNILCFEEGKNSTFYESEEEKAITLIDYDSINKGLYFLNSNGSICYTDGKTVSVVHEPEPYLYLGCKDGYFYFKDGSVFCCSVKGSPSVELGEAMAFGDDINTADHYTYGGFYFKNTEDEIFFVRNGKTETLKFN